MYPIDIVCAGIGENGHLAFNDPYVADFADRATIKVVELDEQCRAQQVYDSCFTHIDLVPRQAITLTLPALMQHRQSSAWYPDRERLRLSKPRSRDQSKPVAQPLSSVSIIKLSCS